MHRIYFIIYISCFSIICCAQNSSPLIIKAIFSNTDNFTSKPKRTIKNNGLETRVSYQIDTIGIRYLNTNTNEVELQLDGFYPNQVLGEPSYTERTDAFIVPQGYTAVLEIGEIHTQS